MNESKELIIFLNGSFHDEMCWKFFVDYFSENYTKYTIRVVNYNRNRNSQIADYVRDFAQVIENHNYKKINVIAHSLGTVVLQRYMRQYPNKINRSILISPVPPRKAAITMIKAQLKMGKKGYDEVFFSNRIDKKTIKKYTSLLVQESNQIKIGLMKNSLPKFFETESKILVLGSFNDMCMPISGAIETASFFKCKCVLDNELCHDMMLDPEWKRVAEVIVLFLSDSK